MSGDIAMLDQCTKRTPHDGIDWSSGENSGLPCKQRICVFSRSAVCTHRATVKP
jgi:hypothetical protein